MPLKASSKAPFWPRKESFVSPVPVEADAGLSKIQASYFSRHVAGYECAVSRYDKAQPSLSSEIGEFEEILPQQRLASREKEHRYAEVRKLADEGPAFCGIHLRIVIRGTGSGIAVDAVEVAAPGAIPDHNRPLHCLSIVFPGPP